MKLRMKKIAIVSFLVACCMIGGVGTLSASATETIYVDGNVAVKGFSVTDGASILMKTDYAGIRYETHVTTEFITYLEGEYGDTTEDGTTYEWHTLITGTNMLPNGKITDVTPDLTKAQIGKEDELACKNFTLTPIAESTGVYYKAAILYYGEDWTSLSSEIKDSYYKAELIARSYVKITPKDATESTIIYAEAKDTIRSMKQVACTAVACEDYKKCNHSECEGYTECQTATEEEKAEKKDLLMNYVGTVSTNKTAYYSAKDGNAIIKNLTEGVNYEAYINGNLVKEENVTASGNNLTVSNLTTTDYTIGEDFEMLLVGDDATLSVQPVKYVSDVITTAAELQAIVPESSSSVDGEVEGYYVLGKDIDIADGSLGEGISFKGIQTANKGKFTGTFDGCGYAINNLTYGESTAKGYGLFGKITGKICNVAFTNVKLTGSSQTVIGYCLQTGSVLENIYVEMDAVPSTVGGLLYISYTTSVKFKDIVIVSVAPSKINTNGGLIYGNKPSELNSAVEFENVHIISSDARLILDATNSAAPYLAVSKTNYDAFVTAMKVTFPYSTNNSYELSENGGVYTFSYNSKNVKLICLEGVTSATAATDGQKVGSWKYDATAGTFIYQN